MSGPAVPGADSGAARAAAVLGEGSPPISRIELVICRHVIGVTAPPTPDEYRSNRQCSGAIVANMSGLPEDIRWSGV
jgi:hypothetical protein